jgi:phosphinothricin acetyltransferase
MKSSNDRKGRLSIGYLHDCTPLWQSIAMRFSIRSAQPEDALAIAGIYAHHVRHGTGTFEIDPPDAAEIAARMNQVAHLNWPWLVGLNETGGVLGYAYAGPFRARQAYRHTVEDSIYLAPEAQRKGIGRALLNALIVGCRERGALEMLAVIGDSANVASIALHSHAGFAQIGVLTQVGHKFGRTLDVVLMQKSLRTIDTPVQALIEPAQ